MKVLLFAGVMVVLINPFTLKVAACGGDLTLSVPHIHDREALLAHVANNKENPLNNSTINNSADTKLKKIEFDNFFDNYSKSDVSIQPEHSPQ